MNRLTVTIDATYDQPLSEEERLLIIDRFYSRLNSDQHVMILPGRDLFDLEIDAALSEEE